MSKSGVVPINLFACSANNSRFQRHVLEFNRTADLNLPAAIKAEVTVVLSEYICCASTNIPSGLIKTLPDKCQVFAFCGAIAGNVIKSISPSPSIMVSPDAAALAAASTVL